LPFGLVSICEPTAGDNVDESSHVRRDCVVCALSEVLYQCTWG
jgi:hypothetical protein